MKSEQVVLIGGGGHASVIYQLLIELNIEVVAVVSSGKVHPNLAELDCFGTDNDFVKKYPAGSIQLVNGVGSLAGSLVGCDLYERYRNLGYYFRSVVSNCATVDNSVTVKAGAIIMNGSVIQSGSIIGENTVVNTGAIVDHDCVIGSNNHIAPGAIICGGVISGDKVSIATGACVAQGIKLGKLSIVGAGAVVVRDLPENTRIIPAPQRIELI